MTSLTTAQYEKQVAECENLCVITDEMLSQQPDLMRCVTCPFCRETVDAILTQSTISCPSCETTVSR